MERHGAVSDFIRGIAVGQPQGYCVDCARLGLFDNAVRILGIIFCISGFNAHVWQRNK